MRIPVDSKSPLIIIDVVVPRTSGSGLG
jgi:hypothetical protein